METIKELMELLGRMQENKTLRKHTEGLYGPRKRGSITDFGLNILDNDLPLVEFTPQEDVRNPSCKYFKFHSKELYGRLGAVALQVALERGWVVKSREGDHGTELYRDVLPEPFEMPKTDRFTVILGPDESSDELVVYTWHPGEVLRSYKNELTASTAVKVHNG